MEEEGTGGSSPTTITTAVRRSGDTEVPRFRSLVLTAVPHDLGCAVWTDSDRLLLVGRWRHSRTSLSGVFLDLRALNSLLGMIPHAASHADGSGVWWSWSWSWSVLRMIAADRWRQSEWQQQEASIQGHPFEASFGQHASAVVGSCMFLFGGAALGDLTKCTNAFVVLNTANMRINKLECRGKVPAPRRGHTLSSVGNRLYLFGGELSKSILTNDLHAFETGLMEWREIETAGDCPERRTEHAAAVLANKIYVFGGRNEQGRLLNDLYVLHTGAKPRWEQLAGKGTPPPERAGHSMAAVGTRLFVFGGRILPDDGQHAARLQDLHMFDLVSHRWREVRFTGEVLPTGPYLAAVQKTTLALIGGIAHSKRETCLSLVDTGKISFADAYGPVLLRDDLQALVGRAMFSDITFMVQGQAVCAHRCILEARMAPESLATLLGHSPSDNIGIGEDPKDPNEVLVSNTTVAAFTSLLSLLYTDRNRIVSNDTRPFLELVERFGLGDRVTQIGFYPLSASDGQEVFRPQLCEEGDSLATDLRKLFHTSLLQSGHAGPGIKSKLRFLLPRRLCSFAFEADDDRVIRNYQRLLNLQDIVFVVSDTLSNSVQKIATYKCVIVARSEYFRALLSSTFGGETRNEIAINGDDDTDPVDFDTFLGVLEFIFTGTLERFVATERKREAEAKQLELERLRTSIDQPALPLASPLSVWWHRIWKPHTPENPSRPTNHGFQDKATERRQREGFISRMASLLAASTRFALFDLRSTCETMLIHELECRLHDYAQNQPQQSAAGSRRAPEEAKRSVGTIDGGGGEEAIGLVLPLLLVADTFDCELLRSACLNAAALYSAEVRRHLKAYRHEMDSALMTLLSTWLNVPV